MYTYPGGIHVVVIFILDVLLVNLISTNSPRPYVEEHNIHVMKELSLSFTCMYLVYMYMYLPYCSLNNCMKSRKNSLKERYKMYIVNLQFAIAFLER